MDYSLLILFASTSSSDEGIMSLVIMAAPFILPFIVVGVLVKMSRTKTNAVEVKDYITDINILEREDIPIGREVTKEGTVVPQKQKTSYTKSSANLNAIKDVVSAFTEGGKKNG